MPDGTKRVEFGYSRRKDAPERLKIETPWGCVTLWRTPDGERLRVDIEPNGERFAGEVPVYFRRGDISRFGACGFMERKRPRSRQPRKARPAPAPTPERGEPGA